MKNDHEYLKVNVHNHTDLTIHQCGKHHCKPGYTYPPEPLIRDHYLMHFVFEGKGTFQLGPHIFHFEKNHGFVTFPGIPVLFQADREDPWVYYWIGFQGLKADFYLKNMNLSPENPFYYYDRDNFIRNCYKQMLATRILSKGREVRLLGLLYILFSHLIEVSSIDTEMAAGEDQKEHYIKKAINYIESNYAKPISIADIAHHIGISITYLGMIFKEHLKLSPKEYLTFFRVNQACDLLRNSSSPIGEIARQIGYNDTFLFSKVFKAKKGFTPKAYREECSRQKWSESWYKDE